jgi:hypothetical protein
MDTAVFFGVCFYGPAGCHTFIELRLSPFDRFVESHAINAV